MLVGGLLVALAPEVVESFIKELEETDKHPAWVVGRVVAASAPVNSARVVQEEGSPLVIPVTY
jgi:hypothetical protein